MKIELKKIKHVPSLSEETEAFTADLYIDGKRAGVASNRGHGGNTDYSAYDDAGRELIRKAEEYFKSLPDKEWPASNGMKAFSSEMNLEQAIDDLLYAHLREKDLAQFNRKLERAMDKGFVFGVPEESFQSLALQTRPIVLLGLPDGPIKLIGIIKKHVLPKLKDGDILLNTNIPEHILKAAGLRPDQYRKPVPEQKPGERMAKGKAKRP